MSKAEWVGFTILLLSALTVLVIVMLGGCALAWWSTPICSPA